MDAKLTSRFVRSLVGISLVTIWITLACQLPEKLVASITGSKPTGTPISFLVSASITPQGTPYPGNVIQTPNPETTSSEAYPSTGFTQPVSTEIAPATTEVAYPGVFGQGTTTSTSVSVQASPSGGEVYPLQNTTYPGPVQSNYTEIALTLTAVAYPDIGVEGQSAPEQALTQTSTGPYPGVSTPTPSSTSGEPYPGLETSSPTPSPSSSGATATVSGATRTFTSTPVRQLTTTLNPSFSSTSSPVFSGTSTPSSTPVLANTPTPSPSPTQFVVPTATPTFTRTPFLTPTPTLTRTPTITPTPLPAPPWVSSQLHATDPDIVQLASGRVQLVEFFAFWSGTSQAMAPIVHGLEDQYGSRMNFIYLDIDDPANSYFEHELGFRMEPQFFLLDPGGVVLRQWIGYVNREQFVSAFNAALGQ
jgi:thiol-disulfide isomerase/thioredoxin